MQIENIIIQIMIGAVAGTLSIAIGWSFIRPQIGKLKMYGRLVPIGENNDKSRYKLLAQERMIVFVDRINPINLLIRLQIKEYSAKDLQAALVHDIREEFQHNIAQQLYISNKTWSVIRTLKDDTIGMIHHAVESIAVDASGNEMSRKILEHMATVSESPYDLTIELIKADNF